MAKGGAVLYARVSTEEQAKNNSLATQEKDCREYCERHELEVLAVFVDTDSAKTTDREQLQEMLAFCGKNKKHLHAVIIWKVDRLARNTPDHLVLRAKLYSQDIRLLSVNEQLEDSPAGRFMETIFAATAQLDNDVRSDRTSKGMKSSLEKGQWTFQLPLGYVREAGIVRCDPHAGPLLRAAFEQIASGATKDQALNTATRRGLRSKKNRKISPRDFGRMLSNPLYAGIIGTMGVEGRAAFEPLLSQATFDRVQAILSGRRPGGRTYIRSHPDFPLRRLARCNCGKPLTGSWSQGRTQKYPYYHCTSRGHVRVSADTLDAQFVSYVQSLQPDPDYNELLQDLLIETLQAKTEQATKRRRILEGQLLACEANFRKLKDRYLYGTNPLPEEIWNDEAQRLNGERRQIETELALLEGRHLTDANGLIRFAGRVFGQAADVWHSATPEQRMRLQLAYFPEGLSYEAGTFRTARMCVFFKDLPTAKLEIGGMASPAGFEPALSP